MEELFELKLCSTKACYSTKLKKHKKLNFDGIRKKFKVIEDTPIILVIDCEDEIVVHDYGELTFKNLRDEEKIKMIAKKIYGAAL